MLIYKSKFELVVSELSIKMYMLRVIVFKNDKI